MNTQSKGFQQGFTLVELLIALAIGTMLMSVVAATVGAITRAQNLTRDYENIQETLRFTTSIMTRSLRSATKITNLTDNEITLVRSGSAPSCLGTALGTSWTERYYLQGGNLRCQADGNNSEVLAFGVSSLVLLCAEYVPDGAPVEFLGCSTADVDGVMALRLELQLSAASFNQLTTNFEHRFTVTLSNIFSELRN